MKNRYYLALALIAITIGSVTAQRNKGFRQSNCPVNSPNQYCIIDDLTDEQQDKMNAERVKFQKDVQADRNRLGELQAKRRTIETTEPIDQQGLDNIMAEMNKVNTAIQKKRIRHQQTVKSFLTDDQAVAYDSFNGKRGPKNGMGPNQGRNFNKGQCDNKALSGGRGQGYNNQPGYGRGNGPVQGKGNGKGYGRGYGSANSPAMLSDEMQQTIKQAHIDLLKQQQPLTNQLNELDAQLKTMTSGKSVDLKKVDQLIDKQAALRLDIAKLRSSKMQAIRSQMSDEEKIWFDRHHMNRGRHLSFN